MNNRVSMPANPDSLGDNRFHCIDQNEVGGLGIQRAAELDLLTGILFGQLLIVELEHSMFGQEHVSAAAAMNAVARAVFRRFASMPHFDHFLVRPVYGMYPHGALRIGDLTLKSGFARDRTSLRGGQGCEQDY